MIYREPNNEDIGQMIEVTDVPPSEWGRRWLRQRLVRVDKNGAFPFIASCPDSSNSENYNAWAYARIEDAK